MVAMNRAASFRFGFPAFALLLLTSCVAPTTTPPAPVVAPQAKVTDVDAMLARMTLEQKVGQAMVIALDGTRYDAPTRQMIEKHHVGGIIFFARNIESPAQVARVTNELQASAVAANGIGLLIAIDQEGGRVARLTSNKGFTEFPGAMAIGATGQ